MKKTVSLLLTAVFLLLSISVFAQDVICGEVLNTNIRAYVDGLPIKSYNIDGWTGVVAEDLREYGYDVVWDAEHRELYVSNDFFGEVTASYQFEENSKPVGSHAAYVYQTDIKTYVAGKEVKAFNIGGYTIIYIDDLQAFGDVVWNEEKREISYSYRKPWSISMNIDYSQALRHEGYAPDGAETYLSGITHISGKFTKGENEEFVSNGENLEHLGWISLAYNKQSGLSFSFSITAEHLLSDEFAQLCHDISTVRYDGEILAENADLANEHAKFYINGNPVKIKAVTQGMGNNHHDFYFVLDLDINEEDVHEISVEIK